MKRMNLLIDDSKKLSFSFGLIFNNLIERICMYKLMEGGGEEYRLNYVERTTCIKMYKNRISVIGIEHEEVESHVYIYY